MVRHGAAVTRSKAEFNLAMRLIADGHNDVEVARLAGIPRRSVHDWRVGRVDKTFRSPTGEDLRCSGDHDFLRLLAAAYSYLLGQYLGDGCISEGRRSVFRLRIVMDTQYPGVIDECCHAMEALMPGQHAHRQPKKGSRCVEVSIWSKHWPCLFPQHGPGRKHNRPIKLEAWQENLLIDESFVRGLIHSDGCRVVANDRGCQP